MNWHGMAWWRLIAVWVPAVVLCLLNIVVYAWLSSSSGGRAAGLREKVAECEEQVVELKGIRQAVQDERSQVEELDQELDTLHLQTFGGLDDRLTNILRAVGSATREAGLLPGKYNYSATDESKLQLVRFGISFAVIGEYQQIRQMLQALGASPEFLVVDRIKLKGEEGMTSQELRITVEVATYLSEADRAQLDRLTGKIASGGNNG